MRRGFLSWVREQFSEPGKPCDADEERYLSRQQVVSLLGRDLFPEWFAGYPETLWPNRVRKGDVPDLQRYLQKLAEERAEAEKYPEGSDGRESAEDMVESWEESRDDLASYSIHDEMDKELYALFPAIVRAVNRELGPRWTERDARFLEELRNFRIIVKVHREGSQHGLEQGEEVSGSPTFPEYWLPSARVSEEVSPLFCEELGQLTEADYEFLSKHRDVLRDDDDYDDLLDYDDFLDKLKAYPRTDEGRLRVTEMFRERRQKQRELMDKLRNPAFRARLADFEKGLGAKRAAILGAASGANDDVANTVRGERFERHVAEVLAAEWPNFECQHLGKHKRTERGIDLLFLGPNGERIGVQCKQHAEGREPSYQEWQSFLGGCTFHEIREGSRVVVTTGTLTVRQRQEAKKLGVEVFYKDELAQMAEEHGIDPWG